ncbi:S1 family peptidase [Gemmatimonas groenlandica]|uniref:Serine protease n=1 Tax=Gemmatimonas groenlandica TaxID=2732249 RepID=A0A6M4IGC6_9BACT|nr:serine protease [Gemmatimonas groenlandica]QJR34144.1 serine protease [Gemmatimonas groenlandica]
MHITPTRLGRTAGPSAHGRASVRRRFALAAVLLAVIGCQDQQLPTAAEPVGPSRIINGSTVSVADFSTTWPFVVGLRMYDEIGNYGTCTASVLAQRWVVTAAHCVIGLPASRAFVLVGDRDISSSASRTIAVTRILSHPRFNMNTLVNDVALLELNDDANVTPARLPDADVVAGETVRAAGFGVTESGSTSDELRATSLTVGGSDFSLLLTATHFWASAPQSGTCQGDSGGPAINAAGDIVGLTSFGFIPCGIGSGHTSVFRLRQWISESIWGVPDREAPESVGFLTVNPDVVVVGATTLVTASATDENTGNSVVARLEARLDEGGSWMNMTPQDGAFDTARETATAVLTVSTIGSHTVCVPATDAAGNTNLPECHELVAYEPRGGIIAGNGKVRTSYVYDGIRYDDEVELHFTADYRPGATVPSGKTTLRVSEVGARRRVFTLESTSHSYLIFSGPDAAEYQGEGIVKIGESSLPMKFRIWISAIDQTVRLRLWQTPEYAWYEVVSPAPMLSGKVVVKPAAGR